MSIETPNQKPNQGRVRGDGYLYKYAGSDVWWGKYYIPGNPKPQRRGTAMLPRKMSDVGLTKTARRRCSRPIGQTADGVSPISRAL